MRLDEDNTRFWRDRDRDREWQTGVHPLGHEATVLERYEDQDSELAQITRALLGRKPA
jgi:hypothetical protein